MTGTDWRHSWCLRVTEAAIKNIRGILSNYQEAGAWHRKNRGILEAEKNQREWNPALDSEITITAKRPSSVKSII